VTTRRLRKSSNNLRVFVLPADQPNLILALRLGSSQFPNLTVGGTTQFLMGDGTVRFISLNINCLTCQIIGNRADRKVPGDFSRVYDAHAGVVIFGMP
jgi:hypothetical protein